MKMDAAERVSPLRPSAPPPLQGSLSFFRLPTTSWWDSLRSVMAQAMTYHSPPRHPTPAPAARTGDPGSGAFEHGRSIHHRAAESIHTGTIFGFVKEQPCMALSHAFFEVKDQSPQGVTGISRYSRMPRS